MKTSTWLAGCAVAALVCTGALAQEQQKRGTEGSAQGTQSETQQQKGSETTQPKSQAQGQQPRNEAGPKQADQKKAEPQPTQKGAQNKEAPSTNKSAETPKSDTSKSAETPKSDGMKSAETPKSDRQGTADSKSGTDKGAVQLSEKQRTDVHRDILKEKNVNRVNVKVQVRIGEHIPRNVRLAPLPAAIVSIVPAYRSYRYFVVDDRVVIVDPGRYEIVEVIQPTGQVADTGNMHFTLTSQERDIVLREVDLNGSRSTLGIGALTEGAEVPRSIELMEFPSVVVEKVTKLRGYKYFVAEQRLAIVEPQGAKIALVIDAK